MGDYRKEVDKYVKKYKKVDIFITALYKISLLLVVSGSKILMLSTKLLKLKLMIMTMKQ